MAKTFTEYVANTRRIVIHHDKQTEFAISRIDLTEDSKEGTEAQTKFILEYPTNKKLSFPGLKLKNCIRLLSSLLRDHKYPSGRLDQFSGT